jgi:hypothetical protein
MLDASEIRIIKNLVSEKEQLWKKWVRRKIEKLRKEWKTEGNVLGYKPRKAQIKGLKEQCLVQSTLRIWYEAGGKTRLGYIYEGDTEEKMLYKRQIEDLRTDENIYRGTKEILDQQIGFEIEGKFVDIENIETKAIYKKLLRQRNTWRGYTPKATHAAIKEIKTCLSPKERNYWWHLSHGAISTKHTESKWRRDNKGVLVSKSCPLCSKGPENKLHYNLECEAVKKVRQEIEHKTELSISDDEWALNEKGMNKDLMIRIAKARWILHTERGKLAARQRKKLDVDIVMQKVDREFRRAKYLSFQERNAKR